MQGLDENIAQSQAELKGLATEQEAVRADLAQTRQALDAAQNELAPLEEVIANLQSRQEAVAQEVQAAEQQLAAARAETAQLTEQGRAAQERLTFLENELGARRQELAEVQQGIEAAQQRMANLEAEQAQAREALAATEAQQAELQQNIGNLKSEITALVGEQGRMSEASKAMQSDLQAALAAIDAARARLSP